VSPKAPINITSPSDPKVQGSLKGTPGTVSTSSEDSCPIDGEQDEPGEDHRLIQIAQALYRQEKVTVVIKGHFQGYQDTESIVAFG
jgi:hypothetical protein